MMNQLWKPLLLLSLLGLPVLEASEMPNSLRGESQNRELAHVTTLSAPVLATLVTGLTDLSELCYTLNTMMYAGGAPDAPVIIFYDVFSMNLVDGQKNALKDCSNRDVFFDAVDFSKFPGGFIPEEGRDYTYEQTQRFYTSGIWNQPALDPYDVILRFTDSSCLSFNSTLLPFMDDHYVFHSHHIPGSYEIARKYSRGFYEKAFDYISTVPAHPKSRTLWATVATTHTDFDALPVVDSSFEVVRKSFIKREDVAAWLHYVTDEPPYGFFENRWATNTERFMTIALFAIEDEISFHPIPGYMEKDFVASNFYRKVCRPFARGNEK
jgi:hypothetical protein